jgi:hypothetical protein
MLSMTVGLSQRFNRALRLLRIAVLPSLQCQPGFVSGQMLTHGSTGPLILISVWQSQAGPRAARRDHLYQQRVTKFAALLAAPPVEAVYEVPILCTASLSLPTASH